MSRLECDAGYEVDVNGERSFSLSCPPNGYWNQEAHCVETDDCTLLKNNCGPMGLCVDRLQSYRCVCEDGFERRHAPDGSGEWYCGPTDEVLCSGNTCGPYGVCVDLRKAEKNFDSGHVLEERKRGVDTYRCSCAKGYHDTGASCTPLDCGVLTDAHGVWKGNTHVGRRYTLTCNSGAYIWGGKLSAITILCSTDGRWVSVPKCVDSGQEARDAAFAAYHFWMSILMALICVACAALAAGLTMGLVSIEPFELRMLLSTRAEDCTDEAERRHLRERQAHARRLLPVISDHHLLLVTLLLLNSIANEALPIFLDQLVPDAVAVALSVTAVLVFGEILPSAVFTGPSQFRIAASLASLVSLCEAVFWVVAWPIARLLDYLLGEESSGNGGSAGRYNRAELRALLALHGPSPQRDEAATTEGAMATLTAPLAREEEEEEAGTQSFPETKPLQDGPTLDCMELAMVQAVLALREAPIWSCPALSLLRDEQITWVGQEPQAPCVGWVVVCRSKVGCSSGSTSGSQTRPNPLLREDVLGIRTSVGEWRPEGCSSSDPAPAWFGEIPSLAEPVWLRAEDTGLAAYRALAQASLSRQVPAVGLVLGVEQGALQSEATAAPASSGRPAEVTPAVLGAVTLERLAAALMCGAQGVRAPEHGHPCPRIPVANIKDPFQTAVADGSTADTEKREGQSPGLRQLLLSRLPTTPRSRRSVDSPGSLGNSARAEPTAQVRTRLGCLMRPAIVKSFGSQGSMGDKPVHRPPNMFHSWPHGYSPVAVCEEETLGTT